MSSYNERLQQIEELLVLKPSLNEAPEQLLRAEITRYVAARYEGSRLGLREKSQLSFDLYATMRGFDILQELVEDPEISEIMVNGPERIFIEKNGRLERLPLAFDSKDHLLRVIRRCFGQGNRVINEERPIASLRFPDGSRLQAVLPPASPDGPALSLRRFTGFTPNLDELVRRHSLSPEARVFLEKAVRQKENIFISGGTGSGKTTFLNALSGAIPPSERILTIEDTAELNLQNSPNLLRLEARAPGPDGNGEVSLIDLIRAALRLRPDRIIVGEVRGEEAYSMIEAMHSGHPGSMSTGHADSPEDMLERLALLLLMSVHLPWEAVTRLLSSALNLIVQLERTESGLRRVASIVRPQKSDDGCFHLLTLFRRNAAGELLRCRKPGEGVFSERKEPKHVF